MKKLDECVGCTGPDEDSIDYAIQASSKTTLLPSKAIETLNGSLWIIDTQVNLTPLMEGDNETQIEIVKDMLDLQDTRAKKVLLHPVIETFLEIKWLRIQKIFFVTFLSYLFFLITYSAYLANIFYRVKTEKSVKLVLENDRIIFPNAEVVEQVLREPPDLPFLPINSTTLFDACKTPGFTCSLEVALFASIILLLVQELLQMYALGLRRYYREFENVIELVVLTLALVGLGIQVRARFLNWSCSYRT